MAKKTLPRNAHNGRPSTSRRGPRSSAIPFPIPVTTPPDGDSDANHGDIARRAYEIYLARGGTHGQDIDDWVRAEQELDRALRPTR